MSDRWGGNEKHQGFWRLASCDFRRLGSSSKRVEKLPESLTVFRYSSVNQSSRAPPKIWRKSRRRRRRGRETKKKKEKNRQPVFSWASRFRPDSSDLRAEVVAVECERGPSFTPVTMFKFVPGWVPGVPLTFPAAIQRPSFGINEGLTAVGGGGVRLEHVAEIKRWIDTFRQGGEGPARVSPPLLLQRRRIACFLSLSFGYSGGPEELKGLRNKKLKWPILLFRACGYKSERDALMLPLMLPLMLLCFLIPPPEPILRY